MRTLLVTFYALLGIACANYDNYKVYELTTRTEEQNEILLTIKKSPEFDFWSPINKVGKSVSVMVSPSAQIKFEALMQKHKIDYKLAIESVENIVQEERKYHAARRENVKERILFDRYYRYDDINAYLAELATNYSDIVTLINIGQSYYNRSTNLVKISTGEGDVAKPVIFVDAGIHAREWISNSVALYLLNQIVENDTNSALIEDIDWYILPIVNPDGYEYTWTDDRLWRKTISPGIICDGVDANRNFGFHWGESGASPFPFECEEDYAGREAFSEPEAVNLRDILDQIGNVEAYLTLHSCGSYFLYPWGYDYILADNAAELDALAHLVDDAIASVRGTRYTIGNSAIALYAAAGASDDWAKHAGADIVYTIELPCGDDGYGFILDPSEIYPVSLETFEGFKVFHDYIAANRRRS